MSVIDVTSRESVSNVDSRESFWDWVEKSLENCELVGICLGMSAKNSELEDFWYDDDRVGEVKVTCPDVWKGESIVWTVGFEKEGTLLDNGVLSCPGKLVPVSSLGRLLWDERIAGRR